MMPTLRFSMLLVLLLAAPAVGSSAPAEPGCDDEAASPIESLAPIAAWAEQLGDVPAATQRRTMEEILRRVRAQAELRRRDPQAPMPIVQVDVDLTAARPEFRAAQALRLTGRELGIEEFLTPEAFPVLPAYNEEAWFEFLDRTGLRDQRSDRSWRRVHEWFYGYFWSIEYAYDVPTPGITDFVRAVEEAGGRVVFNTARDYTAREATEATLVDGGVRNPIVYLKTNRRVEDHEYKRIVQERIAEEHGLTVAIIDDLGENRTAVSEGVGADVLEVPFLARGFTNELSGDARSMRWALSTFEGTAE